MAKWMTTQRNKHYNYDYEYNDENNDENKWLQPNKTMMDNDGIQTITRKNKIDLWLQHNRLYNFKDTVLL